MAFPPAGALPTSSLHVPLAADSLPRSAKVPFVVEGSLISGLPDAVTLPTSCRENKSPCICACRVWVCEPGFGGARVVLVIGRRGLKTRWRSVMTCGCMAATPARILRSWEWRFGGTWPKRRSSCIGGEGEGRVMESEMVGYGKAVGVDFGLLWKIIRLC